MPGPDETHKPAPTLRAFVLGEPLERLRLVLWMAIALRVLVYFYLDFSNPDAHWQVIDYIYRTGRIPLSREFGHSFHPPLYYLLAVPFLASGSFKVVQLLSLLTSILTIGLAGRLIRGSSVFTHKALVFAFFCLLPEFVTFSLFVSNDGLAYLLGVVMVYLVDRLIRSPGHRRERWLAVVVGLGLLTKMTFICYVPMVLALIAWSRYGQTRRWGKAAAAVGLAALIVFGVGGFKLVQNSIYEGRPFIHNIDYAPSWAQTQRPTYTSFAASVLDVDVTRLLRNPTVATLPPGRRVPSFDAEPTAKHSYPLMLYATFYYSWIAVESNFVSWRTDLRYFGSVIYLFALVPTALMLVGLWRLGRDVRAVMAGADDGTALFRVVTASFFILNTALVVQLGVKYDAWSCFQSRLMFPALLGAVVLLDSGLRAIEPVAVLRRAGTVALVVLDGLFLSYLVMEVALLALLS